MAGLGMRARAGRAIRRDLFAQIGRILRVVFFRQIAAREIDYLRFGSVLAMGRFAKIKHLCERASHVLWV
jgi:hypothetical protein